MTVLGVLDEELGRLKVEVGAQPHVCGHEDVHPPFDGDSPSAQRFGGHLWQTEECAANDFDRMTCSENAHD